MKSQLALEFINSMIANGKTIFICTAQKVVKVTPLTFAKWEKSEYKLFKLSANGDLLMARGKNYDCIVSKNISYVTIKIA
jgi:hypothetical protein